MKFEIVCRTNAPVGIGVDIVVVADVTRWPHAVRNVGEVRVRRSSPVGIINIIAIINWSIRINSPSIVSNTRVRRSSPVGLHDIVVEVAVDDT